ncbi:MAG: hypothetical protein PHQ47_01250 [Candidatus Portnoybacteria bacterium]|nr:hypothetical protein [Candidatus Portnoybacteria bacterium]
MKKSSNKREAQRFRFPKWLECGWKRIGCGRDDCPLCGQIKKDRQAHTERGEDPDGIKAVLEDVGLNFKKILEIIKKDAASKGIDIANIDMIKEPPRPEEFSLYNQVCGWQNYICAILDQAAESGELWLDTPAGLDLSWYSSILLGKVYRQLSNRWEMENGGDYGDFDYNYTRKVIKQSLRFINDSFIELISFDSTQKINLMLAQSQLKEMEKEISKI